MSNELERVARALADDWNPDRDPILTAMFRDYAATAIAAMTTTQVVETVDELDALPLMSVFTDVDGEAWQVHEDEHGRRILSNASSRIPWQKAYFPATALYPHPTPGVLHIAGPCEDGETVTVLCGVVKEAESPKSPDQPVCQACSAVQMDERNELNCARESASDVLAEVRALAVDWHDALDGPGMDKPGEGALLARLDAILDREAGR